MHSSGDPSHLDLLPHHRSLIERSAISPDVAPAEPPAEAKPATQVAASPAKGKAKKG